MAEPTLEEQIMKRQSVSRLAAATAVSVALAGVIAVAQSRGNLFSATLVPAQENPALAAPGVGKIAVHIDERAGEIAYTLSFQELTDVRQAHIHFEKPAINGGIMLWLCNSATNPGPTPATTPPCPVDNGTVSGTLTSADVRAIAAQQLNANDFAKAVELIRTGFAYANVHTGANPGGQIRGQLGQGGSAQ
jgi:hypothetical protein